MDLKEENNENLKEINENVINEKDDILVNEENLKNIEKMDNDKENIEILQIEEKFESEKLIENEEKIEDNFEKKDEFNSEINFEKNEITIEQKCENIEVNEKTIEENEKSVENEKKNIEKVDSIENKEKLIDNSNENDEKKKNIVNMKSIDEVLEKTGTYEEDGKLNNITLVSMDTTELTKQKTEDYEEVEKGSLLDLVDLDENAKIWECILTALINVTDIGEMNQKDITFTIEEILEKLPEFALEREYVEIEQIIYAHRDHKGSLVKRTKGSSPTQITQRNSLESIRNTFYQKSLNEYGHRTFTKIRELNGYTYQDLYSAFDLESNFELNLFNCSEMFSKSGSCFFFTADKKFVLKSISNVIFDDFQEKLEKYFDYILKNNNNSMLARIYGLFSVDVDGFDKLNLILMENLFEAVNLNELPLLKCYDLKGSTVQRNTKNFTENFKEQKEFLKKNIFPFYKAKQKIIIKEEIKTVRGKDCDFLDSEDVFVQLKKSDKDDLLNCIKQDTDFLEKLNWMDYSLIYGVALRLDPNTIIQEKTNLFYKKMRCLLAPNSKIYYCFAIVDFLQPYNVLKNVENKFKSLYYENNTISCVEPSQYAKRFVKFLENTLSAVNI